MSTTTDYQYTILARDHPLRDDQSLPFNDPFHVDLRVWYTPRAQPVPIMMIRKQAPLPHGQLKSHDTARPALKPLLSFLSTAGINLDDQTVNAISYCARALSSQPIRRASHGLVVPGIELLILLDPEAVWEEVNTVRPVPATDACIEALEKLVLGDGGSGSVDRCAVCFEDFCHGSEVARMPCSHVYHGGCIVEWLKTSNLCPLCRYQMPTS